MKHVDTTRVRKGFKVVLESRGVQGAVMVLGVGEGSSAVPEDEHPGAEQWVYVVSGKGEARGRRGRGIKLAGGALLLIGRGEAHRILNVGREKLVTVNFYSPRAYTRGGEVRDEVKRGRRA